MSRPRFLADHDFNFHVVRAVRRSNPAIDIVSLHELGMSAATDSAVLEYAHQSGLLLLSHDVNTLRAEAERRIGDGRSTSGVLFAKQQPSIHEARDTILLIWGASEAEEWVDRIEFIPF